MGLHTEEVIARIRSRTKRLIAKIEAGEPFEKDLQIIRMAKPWDIIDVSQAAAQDFLESERLGDGIAP